MSKVLIALPMFFFIMYILQMFFSRQALLCDVVLLADGLEIPAHKAVLAACSPYFYAMFTGDLAEARADRILLREIDGKALAMLVDFVYTSEIHVTEENVQVTSCLVILTNIYIISFLTLYTIIHLSANVYN